jgi:hypothetical protein
VRDERCRKKGSDFETLLCVIAVCKYDYINRDCSAGRFLILKESAFSGLLGKE